MTDEEPPDHRVAPDYPRLCHDCGCWRPKVINGSCGVCRQDHLRYMTSGEREAYRRGWSGGINVVLFVGPEKFPTHPGNTLIEAWIDTNCAILRAFKMTESGVL